MYSEKTNLIERKASPFYGSYKENSSIFEDVHWQNKKKQRQLMIVTIVILTLTLLGIGIVLAITLPSLIEKNAAHKLSPPNPINLTIVSDSILGRYKHAAVSSEDSLCSDIGRKIMATLNGSAVDAAIAVTLCLGVVRPGSCGLGGGLFMTIYSDETMYALNARETVPKGVDPNVYNNDPATSSKGGLALGIPGELSGLWLAHQKLGKVPWPQLVKDSRLLAQNGFIIGKHLGESLKKHESLLFQDPVLRSEFIDSVTGKTYLAGQLLKRPRLARTLQTLETETPSAFYSGALSADIVADVVDHNGVLTLDDLAHYQAEWVNPVVVEYSNNLTLFTLSFPSSGPVVAMGLQILDGFGKAPENLGKIQNGIDHHRFVETLKFVETKRGQISDPNFDDSSRLDDLLENLVSEEFAGELRARIFDYRTETNPSYYDIIYETKGDSGTAHVSIIGPNGDAVSLTTTINQAFGAGFMGNRTGIIFNNEIDDFSFPNRSGPFGLPPNPFNYVEPGKQPASSMCPLIFINGNAQPVLALGGSGGLNIVPSVLSAAWGALYRNMDIKTATDYPRFRVAFTPYPEVSYEYGFPAYLIQELERKGQRTHRLPLDTRIGNVNSVCVTKQKGEILANADYRKEGSSAGF